MLPTLARAVFLLTLGALIGLVTHAVRPAGLRLASFTPPTSCAAGVVPGDPAVATLTPAKAAALCGDGRVVIADVRSPDRYATGHIAGALHLPCASSALQANDARDRLAGKTALLIYGDSTEEARPVAAEMARRVGRPGLQVAVLAGGFAAWNAAGLACSSGACLGCQVPAQP